MRDFPFSVRWPVTGVFIVNETQNETRRNTQKLFSHHERNCSTKLFYKQQKTVRPSGEEGLVPREEAVAQQIYSSAIGGIVPPGTPHNAKCPPARHRHAKCFTAHHKGRGGWEELKEWNFEVR